MTVRENAITLTDAEQARFKACCASFRKAEVKTGIGTLGEKTLHAILKDFLEPATDCHEQTVAGYIVDILNADGVTEIQTAGFHRLRRKIDAFLPDLPLRIVYPIPARKTLYWFDPETGEQVSRRLSPKRGVRTDALFELYKIRPWLLEYGLTISLFYIDIEEHRLMDGWDKRKKRGSTRVDRFPLAIDRIENYSVPEDYLAFLPADLPPLFTTADVAKAARYRLSDAQTIMRILRDFGLAERTAKQGRSFVYQINAEL